MNYGELIEQTQLYCDDSRGRRITKPIARKFIGTATQDLQRTIRQSDPSFFAEQKCYSVVSATDSLEFDLPADFMQMIAIERLTDNEPVAANIVTFVQRHPVQDNRFLPDGYVTAPSVYLRGSKIGVVAPKESYTLRLMYSKAITVSTDDSDIPDIPVEYHDLICLQAAKKASASEGRKWNPSLEQLRQEGFRELREGMDDRVNAGPTYVNVQH